jgi:membrane protein implicated in regulation of membrane protease activity
VLNESLLQPPRPDWGEALRRLAAVRRLGLRVLPTAWIVGWYYKLGGASAAAGLVWIAAGVSWIAGALFLIAATLTVVSGREVARRIKTGDFSSGRRYRTLRHMAAHRIDATASTVLSVLDGDGTQLADGAIDRAMDWIEGKPNGWETRSLSRAMKDLPVPLVPGERALVTVPAVRLPYGRRRALAWLTLGVTALRETRLGLLAVTDRRLIVVYRATRWSPPKVLFADQVADVEVLQWYRRRLQSYLILRRPDGAIVRMALSPFWWRDQARLAFELLASISKHPPPALEAYLRREGVRPPVTSR